MEYSASFDTLQGERFSASPDNPSAAAAVLAQVFGSGEEPALSLPPDMGVLLPVGLERDGERIRHAEVRELTGADEERLARTQGYARYLDSLVTCGTVSIGDEPATPALLRGLMVGDREALILAIRIATFGTALTFTEFVCPHCGEKSDITVHLNEIALRGAGWAESFEVTLRDGSIATWRWPNGHDHLLFDDSERSAAEANTLLLSRCLVSITKSDGTVLAGSKQLALKLGVADRRALVSAISDHAPGPSYDEVRMVHDACGKEVPIVITIWDLFRG